MPEKEKYKITRRYRIYENREGLMKRPTYDDYGGTSNVFDDFDTMEEAEAAIMDRRDSHIPYVVMPVVTKEIDW